jgi:hypothetical protein
LHRWVFRGHPQCGQVTARSDTGLSQSGHGRGFGLCRESNGPIFNVNSKPKMMPTGIISLTRRMDAMMTSSSGPGALNCIDLLPETSETDDCSFGLLTILTQPTWPVMEMLMKFGQESIVRKQMID